MNSKVLCQGCKLFKSRDDMQKVGLGYVCDETCMERVKQRARDKHARRRIERKHPVRVSGDQRRRVRKRDGCCRWCGTTSLLQVHHVLYLSQGGPNDMGNLVTLCLTHHEKVHTNKRVWQPVLLELLRLTEGGQFMTVLEVQNRLKIEGGER